MLSASTPVYLRLYAWANALCLSELSDHTQINNDKRNDMTTFLPSLTINECHAKHRQRNAKHFTPHTHTHTHNTLVAFQ